MIELVAFIAVVVVGGYFLFLMIVTENEGSVSDFLGGPPYFRGILGVLFPIFLYLLIVWKTWQWAFG